MVIGGFSKDQKEYIIKTNEKNIPAPWSHIIANENFGTLVTVNGGGYTWYGNSRENKLTSWSNDQVSDYQSEEIYIIMKNNKIINIVPRYSLENYEVHFGFGYAIFKYEDENIRTNLTIYVPIDKKEKIYNLEIENLSESSIEYKICFEVEPVLGVAREFTKKHLIISKKDDKNIEIRNYYRENYNEDIVNIESSECNKYDVIDKIITMTTKINLSKNEKKNIMYKLGIKSDNSTNLVYEKMLIDLEEIRNYWNNKISKIQIKTPIESMNIMMNGWLIYQTIVSRLYSRTAFYQAGGAFGFRDQLQDSLLMLHIDPSFVRNQIIYHAMHQFKEGDVLHWWHPEKSNGIRTRYTDDMLWLPYLICEYIEKEADYSILDEKVKYVIMDELKEDENEKYNDVIFTNYEETIYEHAIKAINRSLNFGPHNLPKMGSGDWNDGMNNVKGESVWLGFFMYLVIDKFIKLCEYKNDTELIEKYIDICDKLKISLNDSAWDGEWYKRGYFGDNTPLRL